MWLLLVTNDSPCCCVLAIKKCLQGFVVIVHDDVRSLEIMFPFGYGIICTIGFLLWSASFSLSVHECM